MQTRIEATDGMAEAVNAAKSFLEGHGSHHRDSWLPSSKVFVSPFTQEVTLYVLVSSPWHPDDLVPVYASAAEIRNSAIDEPTRKGAVLVHGKPTARLQIAQESDMEEDFRAFYLEQKAEELSRAEGFSWDVLMSAQMCANLFRLKAEMALRSEQKQVVRRHLRRRLRLIPSPRRINPIPAKSQ